jgi:hypothetical protein
LFVINERHLHAVLVDFADYYNLTAPIGASRSNAHCPGPWPATDRSPDELRLEACTTCMRAPHELESCFAPLHHFNVTASATAAWIWRQLVEATPWGRHPTHLIHDRDAVHGRDIDARLAKLGIAGVRTPVLSSRETTSWL